MSRSILITGITGFLGSHLAANFLHAGYHVVGLKRSTSNTWRLKEYHSENLSFVDSDSPFWKSDVINLKPVVIIHAAWDGVTSDQRNSLTKQLENLTLLSNILEIAGAIKPEKFIGIGSQAEYGQLMDTVSENATLNPDSAYGMVKVLASNLTQQFCSLNKIRWYWLRVFSVFGQKESLSWFIPSVIQQLLSDKPRLEFSPGTQKYAYLYIADFSRVVALLISSKAESGVYNVSGTQASSLRAIVERIKEQIGNQDSKLDFSALPFRENQSMHIEGDMTKFFTHVGEHQFAEFNESLTTTIAYYKQVFLKVIN